MSATNDRQDQKSTTGQNQTATSGKNNGIGDNEKKERITPKGQSDTTDTKKKSDDIRSEKNTTSKRMNEEEEDFDNQDRTNRKG